MAPIGSLMLCITLAISMAAAVPVPDQKPSARALFDEHNNRIDLPWQRPHHVILPIDEYRPGDEKAHPIVSHKFYGLHHPSSAAEEIPSKAVQGRVMTTDTDASEGSFDELNGNEKGLTEKTKEQLEAEKDDLKEEDMTSPMVRGGFDEGREPCD